VIGVISDTHGLLRPEAVQALQGVDVILHAGDVGGSGILPALEAAAPVKAVRGNVDHGEWAADLRHSEVIDLHGFSFYILHDYQELDLNLKAAGFDAVIFGHSHKPSITWREGVLLLNPGSAGPRRFNNPVTLAIIDIKEGKLDPRIVQLNV
jgi:uncharacterized protein